MSQVLLARITCPNCRNVFQAPVEQILDVGQDPTAKLRTINGLVNLVHCPHCGMDGQLNLPFFYHDPKRELALVYMPLEAGRDEMERQRFIGSLTSAVINGLPMEERKGYLLQPQIMITMDGLINKVLEADGITKEMIEAQRAKAALLRRLVDASSEEIMEVMIRENDALIDDEFFRILLMNLEIARESGQGADIQRLIAVRHKLLEASSEGRRIKVQGEMLEALRNEPTREKLLDLLVEAPDRRIREALIILGLPLVDYRFFQLLTMRLEETPEQEEKERLASLRAEILEVRGKVEEATRALYAERSALLRALLQSENPEALARRRFAEIDQAFINLLTASLEEARSTGDLATVRALQDVWNMILKLTEETLPPEIQLFNRLMNVESEGEVEKLLQENRELLTAPLLQFMERAAAEMEEAGDEEITRRARFVLERARALAPAAAGFVTSPA
ncbi:MAG: CpXC domain-containing protein [Anaerolineae bacterium]|nr:CpXC domain-containing protein [Anaerolineae bacterium]